MVTRGRKNCFLAEKRARLFSWKQITSVNCLDSPFRAANLQPATALNYVGSSFQAIRRMASHWVVSAYFSKLSNLQPVAVHHSKLSSLWQLRHRVMPAYLSKLSNTQTVPYLSYLGSPSKDVKLTTNPVSELTRFTFPNTPTCNCYFTKFSRLTFRSCAASPSLQSIICGSLCHVEKHQMLLCIFSHDMQSCYMQWGLRDGAASPETMTNYVLP